MTQRCCFFFFSGNLLTDSMYFMATLYLWVNDSSIALIILP
jgi:hypothetical protein